MLHRFTHAKTHRAGGFLQPGEALCSQAQSRAQAICICISYTDKLAFSLPGRFLMRGRSAGDFGVGSQMLAAQLFECPQRDVGRYEERQQTNMLPHCPNIE